MKRILLPLISGFLALSSSNFASAHAHNGFCLITTLYNETHPKRIKEYLTCLEINLQHPLIQHIHVLYDTSKDDGTNTLLNTLLEKKISITYITGRPSYGDFFRLANEQYPNQAIILSNADIYFNETLELITQMPLDGVFIALTRWNLTKGKKLVPFIQGSPLIRSQDSWIFTTPLIPFQHDHFLLGTWGCDGAISAQAYLAGLTVINPCKDIQCCHMHLSNIRNETPILKYPDDPQAGIPWTTMQECIEDLVPNKKSLIQKCNSWDPLKRYKCYIKRKK